jgi:ribonuclease P protein component
VLPINRRLRHPAEFSAAVSGGRRGGRGTLVVHVLPAADTTDPVTLPPARAGFIVSKAVGGAVVRNRVKRRLRHLVVPTLDAMPVGTRLVIRALPASATASSARLGTDLAAALRSAARRGGRSEAGVRR